MPSLDLTEDEALLLDGRVSEKAQEIINTIKMHRAWQAEMPDLPPRLVSFIADVMKEVEETGKLTFRRTLIQKCNICGRQDGYARYRRTTRFQTRGQLDYSKPILIRAIEMADRNIIFKERVYLGGCEACIEQSKTVLIERLNDVRAELPEALMGHEPLYVKKYNRKCGDCGWEGHEGLMIKTPNLMGYRIPTTCPECKRENKMFGPDVVKLVDGFTIVEIPAKATTQAK